MLSTRLVQLIEDHWEAISNRALRDLRQDARLRHISGMNESEMLERTRDILKHLSRWMAASSQQEVANHFERIGRRRFEEGIPAHEVLLAYCLIKQCAIDFVRNQGIGATSVELYAEEELEHTVDHFFDNILYHMVRGYEEALGEAARRAPRVGRASAH